MNVDELQTTNNAVENIGTFNASSSLSTVSIETIEQNSTVSSSSRKSKHEIPTKVNIESWRGDTKSRYFLADFISLSNGKMDKKVTIDIVSDAVVWNIVYLMELRELPTESPPHELRLQALLWLIDFRKQMLNLLREKIQRRYLMAANSKAWEGLRKTGEFFTTYSDLIEKTKTEKEELVSGCE